MAGTGVVVVLVVLVVLVVAVVPPPKIPDPKILVVGFGAMLIE